MVEPGVDPGAGAPSAPPGWYPVDGGIQRYWDGSRWTEHTAPAVGSPGGPAGYYAAPSISDDRTMALLAHLLGLFTGFLGPLVVWLVKKDQSPFVDHHGKEALNFQLTLLIAYIAAFVAALILIGFLLIPILMIINIVFPILAAIAANRGEYYRYPLTLRLIS